MCRLCRTMFGAALVLVVAWPALGGCRRGDSARATAQDESHAGPQIAARIFVNNLTLGPTQGCDGPLGLSGPMVCGPRGAASKITWKFLGHDSGADVYDIVRTFPVGGENAATDPTAPAVVSTTAEKRLRYSGGVLVVFEDEAQRVVVYEASAGGPPAVDQQTPRVP